jgi:hypothetical protein
MGTCSHVSWSALWSIAHLAKSLTGKLARNQKGPLLKRKGTTRSKDGWKGASTQRRVHSATSIEGAELVYDVGEMAMMIAVLAIIYGVVWLLG